MSVKSKSKTTKKGRGDLRKVADVELGEITRRMRKLYTPGNQPIESIGVVLGNLADEIDSIVAAPQQPLYPVVMCTYCHYQMPYTGDDDAGYYMVPCDCRQKKQLPGEALAEVVGDINEWADRYERADNSHGTVCILLPYEWWTKTVSRLSCASVGPVRVWAESMIGPIPADIKIYANGRGPDPGPWWRGGLIVHGAQPKQGGRECPPCDECDDCNYAAIARAEEAEASLLQERELGATQADIIERLQDERNELRRKLEGQEKRVGELEAECSRQRDLVTYWHNWASVYGEEFTKVGQWLREHDVFLADGDMIIDKMLEWADSAVGAEPQPESTEQDDRGELPGCPDCGKVPLPSPNQGYGDVRYYQHWCGGRRIHGYKSDWLRHVAERTVCRECGSAPSETTANGVTRYWCGHTGCVFYMQPVMAAEWLKENEVKDGGLEMPEVQNDKLGRDGEVPEMRRVEALAEEEVDSVSVVPSPDAQLVHGTHDAGGDGEHDSPGVAPALERAREAAEGLSTIGSDGKARRAILAILERLEGEREQNTDGFLSVERRLNALEEKVSLIDRVSARTNKERGERLTDIERRMEAAQKGEKK